MIFLVLVVKEEPSKIRISEIIDPNQSTVAETVAKFKSPEHIDDAPRAGRPRTTEPHQDRLLRHTVESNRYWASPDFLSKWLAKKTMML